MCESFVAAMVIVEEGQNQSKLARKRIKFEEMVDKGKEDRSSALPDCLLLEILPRLPSTKGAIRTGALSKRWKHLWTLVSTLIFKHNDYKHRFSDFVSFVDKTLSQCRQVKLKKFELSTYIDIGCGSEVNNWSRHAIRCNVEELNLRLWGIKNEYPLDQSFFISSCFTDLTLQGCMFNPIGAISWKNLRSLCISTMKLDDAVIENILSGTPVLETLVLNNCYGYSRLEITSKSVKKLVLNKFFATGQHNTVEIKAPKMLSLTIKGFLWLRKLLLLNMSSLVEANLDYAYSWYEHEEIPFKEVEEEMLKGLISNLRHVKDFKIGGSSAKLKFLFLVFVSNHSNNRNIRIC